MYSIACTAPICSDVLLYLYSFIIMSHALKVKSTNNFKDIEVALNSFFLTDLCASQLRKFYLAKPLELNASTSDILAIFFTRTALVFIHVFQLPSFTNLYMSSCSFFPHRSLYFAYR
jgi:hypothetical protein